MGSKRYVGIHRILGPRVTFCGLRGLKHWEQHPQRDRDVVAPLGAAWIETTLSGMITVRAVVAPRAGAWIETKSSDRVTRPAPPVR